MIVYSDPTSIAGRGQILVFVSRLSLFTRSLFLWNCLKGRAYQISDFLPNGNIGLIFEFCEKIILVNSVVFVLQSFNDKISLNFCITF